MNRCTKCWMPDTRPGSRFVNGVCGACHNYDRRAAIDWDKRWGELEQICATASQSVPLGHDCLIPVSGGKDSFTLVKVMTEDMGMNPLLVTVTDPFTHTEAGKYNLSVLMGRHDHYMYSISRDLFCQVTRRAFEETGETLKFVETAIYTIPFLLACGLGIPLVVFGENSAYEYGSSEEDIQDAGPLIWRMCKQHGFRDVAPNICGPKPKAIFLSHFMPWSSVNNLAIARERGFWSLDDTREWQRQGTIEQFEQIDSAGYMVHLWLKYPKFGFQRAMDIASRRLREGLMTLDEVKDVAQHIDPILDPRALDDFCSTLGYTEQEFWKVVEKLWNPDIFECENPEYVNAQGMQTLQPEPRRV